MPTAVAAPAVPVAYPCQNPINQLHLTHLIHLSLRGFNRAAGRDMWYFWVPRPLPQT
jgi:hypothetical protein